MTITSTTNRVSYAGDGNTTAFSFPHRFLADADLTVILVVDSTGVETTQTITTDYTVSGAGAASGGTVTMNSAPATGETLVIINDPDLKQGYDPEDGSALGADSLETAVDKLTILAQRTRNLVARAFRFSDGVVSSASLELPPPVALRLFRWNSDADALELVQVSSLGDLAALADQEVMAKVPGSDADGIAIGVNQFLGRLSGGNLKALTSEETRRVLDDPEHATDSATDTYVSATNTTVPGDGVKITRDFQSANATTTPTLDGKTMTTRDGSALWEGAVSGPHELQRDQTADTYLVLEPSQVNHRGWELVGTVEAANDATLTITGLDSTYDTYAIAFSDLRPATDTVTADIRVGDSNGIDSGASDYQWLVMGDKIDSTTFALSGSMNNATSAIRLVLGSIGNAAGEGFGGIIYLHRPADGTTFPTFSGSTTTIDFSANSVPCFVSGTRLAAITLDRIQFFFSSGNVESGRMTVWGVRHD